MRVSRCRVDSAGAAVLGLSLAAFGALGWLTAHTLTWTLFAHSHGAAVAHLHSGPVVLTAALTIAAVSVLTLALVATPVVGQYRVGPGDRDVLLCRRMTVVAPVVFVTVELIEHVARGGLAESPLAVLLVGVVLHVLAGMLTPTLWLVCVRTGRRAAMLLAAFEPAAGRTVATVALPVRGSVSHRPAESCSRGPPVPRRLAHPLNS